MTLEVTEAWITTDAVTPYLEVTEAWIEASAVATVTSLSVTEAWIEAVTLTNLMPVAEAGPAQTVEPWDTVTLDGSASQDPDGTFLTDYVWSQTSGTAVSLSSTGSARTFQAPASVAGGVLIFSLTVSDGIDVSQPDTVSVTVLPVTERAVLGSQEVPLRMMSVSSI